MQRPFTTCIIYYHWLEDCCWPFSRPPQCGLPQSPSSWVWQLPESPLDTAAQNERAAATLPINKKQTIAMTLFLLDNNSSHVHCFVNKKSCTNTMSCNYGQCLFGVMVMIQYSRGIHCFLSKAQKLSPHRSCYKYKHSLCSFNSQLS